MAADKKQRHLKPQMQNSKVRLTAADHTFNVIVNVFMVLILIVILIPVWSTITLSFRPNDYLGSNLQGMFMPPWEWSPDAYTALLGNDGFLDAFLNSFKILIGGSVLRPGADETDGLCAFRAEPPGTQDHKHDRDHPVCIQRRHDPDVPPGP